MKRLAVLSWATVFGLICNLQPAVAQEDAAEEETKTLSVAHIVIKGAYPEGPSSPGLLGSVSESLTDGINRLKKAGQDENIHAVVLRIQGTTLGFGKLNELRTAIHKLRDTGKKVYAVMDSASTGDYLLATACDQIIMPESATWMVLGLRAEVTFYKNLFDKLDIEAEMLRIGEFKSAAEPYNRTEMSPEFRKEMEELLDDNFTQLVNMIATGRKISEKDVENAINSAPLTMTDAKKLRLVDHVAYADEVEAIIKGKDTEAEVKLVKGYGKKKIDTDFSGLTGLVKMMNMMMGVEPRTRPSRTSKIAVIYATGTIMPGRSTTSIMGGTVMGSDTIIEAVRKAEADETVKAIVLRVDSPGGSALASDLMWRALEQVQKPFVVSMGNVAASGGYYISMGADRIFAEPGTVTGSIGVVGGKVAIKGLMNKVGVTTSVISRGKHSGILSMTAPFTDSERQAMQKMMQDIYDQFTHKAAAGRKMEQPALEKLARGRIYTGATALKIGLVDELGTLEDAIKHAARLAKVDPKDDIERLILPRPTSPFESLFGPIDASLAQPQSRELQQLIDTLSPELKKHLQAALILQLMKTEQRMMVLPYQLKIR